MEIILVADESLQPDHVMWVSDGNRCIKLISYSTPPPSFSYPSSGKWSRKKETHRVGSI